MKSQAAKMERCGFKVPNKMRKSSSKNWKVAVLLPLVLSGCASNPDTRLVEAIKHWEMEDAQAALDAGANPNLILPNPIAGRKTPILIDSINGRPPFALLLLEHGADVNRPDADGNTPLIAAISNSQAPKALVEAILKRHPDVNARNRYGITALLKSPYRDSSEAIGLTLLARGADFRVRDHDGRDTLFYAASQGRYRVIQALLKKGLNPRRKDNFGETPLDFARRSNYSNSQTVQILVAATTQKSR